MFAHSWRSTTIPACAAPKSALKSLFERTSGAGAGPAYSRLHLRLVSYFRIRFPAEAEALADETIDRLARRLQEGISVENLAAYALGIARFIVLETNARQRKEREAAREIIVRMEPGPEEPDAMLPLLHSCLGSFDADSVRLIMAYYAVDSGVGRIEQRRRLARRLGMSLNALRNRALRIRVALEKSVRAQMAAELGHAPIFSAMQPPRRSHAAELPVRSASAARCNCADWPAAAPRKTFRPW